MIRKTIKRIYKKKSNKNKRKTKKIKQKVKNLGKKFKTYKRIQYGCTSKNMKGGGPLFNPVNLLSQNMNKEVSNLENIIMGK